MLFFFLSRFTHNLASHTISLHTQSRFTHNLATLKSSRSTQIISQHSNISSDYFIVYSKKQAIVLKKQGIIHHFVPSPKVQLFSLVLLPLSRRPVPPSCHPTPSRRPVPPSCHPTLSRRPASLLAFLFVSLYSLFLLYPLPFLSSCA